MRRSILFLFLVGALATAQSVPTVPDSLKVPTGSVLVLRVKGAGDQVYVCDGSSWTLSRPDAQLFDDSGNQIGSHFAGPTWQYKDGSRVTGKAIANASPDPGSVPWLLLQAKAH
jgi:hypothetical protein